MLKLHCLITAIFHFQYVAQLGEHVASVSVNAPASVNVDNYRRYRSLYCKRDYNNGTVSVNVNSNWRDLSRFC